MAAGCHLGFDCTENSAVQSDDPENSTLEPNRKWIRWSVVEMAISKFNPHFEGRGRL